MKVLLLTSLARVDHGYVSTYARGSVYPCSDEEGKRLIETEQAVPYEEVAVETAESRVALARKQQNFRR